MKTPLHRLAVALVAALTQLSAINPTFAQSPLPDDFNPGANASVLALAVQADGKVLVGGEFTTLAGQTRNYLGRLYPDGTLDSTFNPGSPKATGNFYPYVYSLAVQPDGRILVGGSFSSLGGQPRSRIGRLSADGTLDSSFNPEAGGDSLVLALMTQADGKILVGGSFTTLGGQTRNCLGRLNADGTLDSTLSLGAGRTTGTPVVYSLALQADGKILVGGYFTTLGGQFRNYIGRLNADGTLDTTFNPGASLYVHSLAVQADGKILVGGSFTTLGGQPRNGIGRLNADGTLDSTFDPGAAGSSVYSLVVQADGRILVGGAFNTLGGQPRNGIGRLNADGTLDSTFGPGESYSVTSLAMQADGKILVGGGFTTLGGQPRNRIGRLNNTEPATQSLNYDGSTITWMRGGSSPEVWRTSFDVSTNGTDWSSVGAGSRVANGWQLSGVAALPDASIRARGYLSGGQYNSSSAVVERTIGRPGISFQPNGRTNSAGTTARFDVLAGGTAPLGFLWLKDGVPLANGGDVAGAGSAMLTLTNVMGSDAGGYNVVVSNVFGSVTSTVARLAVIDPAIVVQPVGQRGELGQTVTLSLTVAGSMPLNYEWRKEGGAIIAGSGPSLTLTNLQAGDAGYYRVVISNQYGSVISAPVEVSVNLASLETGFVVTGVAGEAGRDRYVGISGLAVQRDGKMLVGGRFSLLYDNLDGVSSSNPVRLNGDGTVDSGFSPRAVESDAYDITPYVNTLTVQPDGKILVGGLFTALDGQPRTNLARLNANGTLDTGFKLVVMGRYYYHASVYGLTVQADGKVLVVGAFTSVGGQARTNIARLNVNGTLDSGFKPVANGSVYSLTAPGSVLSAAVQPDGKILIGGSFTRVGGQARTNIARLNADGTLDAGFAPGADGSVNSLAVQADGKILVGGSFTTLGQQPRNLIGRLNANGTLDSGFKPDATGNFDYSPNYPGVHCLALQADGKILVGGSFTTVSGQPRTNIARLYPDGTLDSVFNPGSSGESVLAMAIQPDAKIVYAERVYRPTTGNYETRLKRFNNTAPATQSLNYAGSTITWLRSGTGPEAWRTSFDITTDGSSWSSAGASGRISGGWQRSGVTLPSNGTIRARGFVTGGTFNGSGWFLEEYYGQPVFLSQPASQTNNAGTLATFSVSGGGSGPLTYQWRKDGVGLVDQGNVGGAVTATLMLTNVLGSDAGFYSVVVSNSFGSVTSAVARLTVIDPLVAAQPVSQSRIPGHSVAFSVTAAGTPPFGYQWWKDGIALSGGTEASLALANLQAGDAGNYHVVLSNQYGSAPSAVAELTVNLASVDSDFNPGLYPGAAWTTAVQADGKILVGGSFTTVGGQPRTNIARLNANGTLDIGFNPGADGSVHSLAVQADGKILVGGHFYTLGGQPREHIARLNADGTLDNGFNPGAGYYYGVDSLAVQTDGKILVGGDFDTLGGQPRQNIGRLNADGTVDTGFNPGADGSVRSLAVQADGKILVGGDIYTLGGQPRNCIGRLNTSGTVDSGFNPGVSNVGFSHVFALAVQLDGKILVGGIFTALGGQPRTNIARLNTSGTVDTGFNPGAGSVVETLAVQADGKILVGGTFATLGGQPRNRIGRLNTSGTLDSGFNPGAGSTDGSYSSVSCLAVQADGGIVVGGQFTTLGGQPRQNIARLFASVSASITAPMRSGVILAGDALRFSGAARVSTSLGPPQFRWQLGDGRESALDAPGVVGFQTPGTNWVTLNVTDNRGTRSATPASRLITVAPATTPVPDFHARQLSGPSTLTVEQPTSLSYVVENTGDASVTGRTWTDAIYLSTDPWLDTSDRFLASTVVSNDLSTAGSYTNTVSVTIPLVAEGSWYLLLSVDDQWQILERHQLNNELAVPTDLFVPRLTNGIPYTGTFSASGEARYFRIDVPAGQSLFLRLNDADHQGINGIYVRRGALPTRGVFDFAGAQAGRADQQVLIPAAGPGTYYVMVYGEFVPGNGTFSLEPLVANLHVVGIMPTRYSQHGAVSFTLTGAGFDSTTSVELLGSGGTYHPASVNADSFTQIRAGFDLGSVPVGVYSVRVSSPSGDSSRLTNAFEVLPAWPAAFQARMVLPGTLGRRETATFFVEYSNAGGTAMRAPLMALSSGDPDGSDRPLLTLDRNRVTGGLWTSGLPQGFGHEVRFRAGANGTGWLQPGESVRVPVYYAGLQQPWDFSDNRIEFRLGVLTDTNATPVDWSLYKDRMRPAYVRPDAWDVVWNNFVTRAGPTWGSYTRMLNENADYLSRIGAGTQDDEMLQAMEFRKADGLSPLAYLAESVDASAPAPGIPLVFRRAYGQPISRRYALGPLGRGWTHNWQLLLQRDTNGMVRITDMSGTPRLFQPDIRYPGKYIAAPGDFGALEVQSGGTFMLREAEGGSLHFYADGRLEYVRDSNGNQITCGYNPYQLTTLNHSSGRSLQLGYNAAGRIQSVTDPYGHTDTFSYDASGEHLVAVRAQDNRVVTYAYHLGQGAAREHALKEIGYPDGSHRYYGYDDQGRLVRIWRDGNAEPVEFLHGTTGEVAVRDVNGHTSKASLDYRNQVIKAEDPLAQSVRISLDDVSNLSSFTDPAGRSVAFQYDSNGRVRRSVDPLGLATQFTYGALHRMTSVTDANNRQTQFSYDSRGNPTDIRYVDGQRESWSYDPQGRPESWTSRRGHQVRFTYDNAGRITSKAYPDGSQAAYVYDSHGNLISFTDATGTTALTFDNDDYLTKITYPTGKWLAFTYDAAGRRATSLDQRGHRLEYHYGALGRLESLTDETGATLVHYAYDPAGRPSRKTLGNGVYATYGYEAAGRLLSLTNWAPGGSLLSQFAFTYDSRGRRTSMATHYGSWTYDYDDAGQLVHAALASTATNIPNQDLTYVYDAVGNRVRTISNGATSEYHVNAMNRYEQVGPATRIYDAAGNLIQETSPDVATAYEYDVENRLSRVTRVINGTTDVWEYAHNALGQRVAATHNGAETRFVIDPVGLGNVVGEYDAAGSLKAHYDHAAGLIARAEGGGGSTFYTADPMGNVAELTGNAGAVLESRSYSPYGVALSGMAESENPFWFAGEFGAATEGHGLVSVRARYLHPNTGRFVQEDPIGIGAGLNYYTYANNNPLSFVDISGLSPRDCMILRGAKRSIGGVGTAATGVGAVAVLGSNPVGWVVALGLGGYGAYEYYGGAKEMLTADDRPEAQQTTGEVVADNGKRAAGAAAEYAASAGRRMAKLSKGATGMAADAALDYQLKTYCAPKTDPAKNLEGPTDAVDEQALDPEASHDPNRMIGPGGVGAANYIPGQEVLPYRIDFENITNATAPAQLVVVTAPLSASLDWGTVELIDLGFGDQMVAVPPGCHFFATNLLVEILGVAVEVVIEAGIRPGSGEFYTVFRTMDPSTGWTPPVSIGFLPPEDGTGRGQGHVSFIVKPKPGLPTGTQIRNVARISFDFQPEIATNQRDPHNPGAGTDPAKECLVTIDAGAPASHALPLPGQSGRTIPVVWTGQDDAGGSGIAFYDVYVTSDSTTWTRWLERTTATRGMFRGELGRTYSFFTLATDNVGNRETNALSAHATTTVATNVPFLAGLSDAAANVGSSFALTNGVTGGPSGSYRFWLGTGAPSGAEVNPTNGVLRWTPSCSQASRSHSITVWVADSANTNLMDATTFTVNVGECVVPSLGRLVLLAGDNGRVPVNLISTVPLTNLAMTVEAAVGRLTNLWIEPIVSQVCRSTIAPTLSNAVPGSDLFDLSLTTCSNQFLIGTQQVAWLHFTAVSNRPSAFVNLKLDNITGWQADGTAVRNFAPQSGRLVIIGEEPLLECLLATNSLPSLVLYGKTGWNCEVQSRPALEPSTPWQFRLQQTMADLFQSYDLAPATNRTQFFRALRQ